MIPIEWYNLHQAGRGYVGTDIGSVYSVAHFVQLGHGIGSVLTRFWRWIKQSFRAEPNI